MTTSPSFTARPALPRLTRNEAHARNLLAQRARDRSVPLAGQPWSAAVEPWLPGAQASAPQPGDWLLLAQWAGAPFEIRLPGSACASLVAARFPETDLPGLPDEFAAAALESALAPLLEALNALQRGPARLEQVLRQPISAAARTLGQVFGLTLRNGAQQIQGALATDALGLMLLAGLVAELPAAPNQLDGDALPMPLIAEIGCTWVAADLLATLALGDAIIIQQYWAGADGEIRLALGAVGVRVQWNDSALTVTQTLAPEGISMPPPSDNPATDQPVALHSVPVRVCFDLGERTMTLGELKALQVGQALELGRPLAGVVNVRANGALIGTGELVEIDGQVGVVLATLVSPKA